MNIIEPLRLATGSHPAGTGKGCAMNVISWENGDTTITDYPDCSDRFLSRIVQRVNDAICTHRDGDLLCAPCSLDVLALSHRTVGTVLDMAPAERARVYVQIAVEEAESVLDHAADPRPRAACALVRRFLAAEAVTSNELREARAAAAAYAADAAANAAAYAANAAAYAADAANADAANAAAYAAANAAAYAADAANAADAYAADAAACAARVPIDRAHHIIDRFEQITGIHHRPVPEDVTAQAVAAMTGVSA